MSRRLTEQQLFDALLARFDKIIAAAFFEVVQNLRSNADLTRLVAAISSGSIDEALSALHLNKEAFDPLVEAIRTGYQESGYSSVQYMPNAVGPDGNQVVIRFSVRNERAEQWLKNESSTLVTNITSDQRVAIRDTLMAGMAAGRNPTETALDIVGRVNRATGEREGGIIGLTSTQESYVRNARAELESGDPSQLNNYLTRTLRDRRFDNIVKEAIANGEPVTQENITKMEDRYRDRLLKLRGDTIGRTESLTALRAAKQEAYEQAIDTSGVPRDQVTRTWRSAGDERVRDTHDEMDGQQVGLDEPFISLSGAMMMFPGDTSLGAGPEEIINCRCDVEYSADFLAAIEEESAPEEGPLEEQEVETEETEVLPVPDELTAAEQAEVLEEMSAAQREKQAEEAVAQAPQVVPPELTVQGRTWPADDILTRELLAARAEIKAAGLTVPDAQSVQDFYEAMEGRFTLPITPHPPTNVDPNAVKGIVQGWEKVWQTLSGSDVIMNEVLEEIATNYPVMFVSLPTIADQTWMGVFSAWGGEKHWIIINTASRTPKPGLVSNYTASSKLGGGDVLTNWTNSVIHELGHAIDEQMEWNLSRALVARILTESNKVEGSIWNSPKTALRQFVSNYATTNPSEAFAEMFLTAIKGEPTPFSLNQLMGWAENRFDQGEGGRPVGFLDLRTQWEVEHVRLPTTLENQNFFLGEPPPVTVFDSSKENVLQRYSFENLPKEEQPVFDRYFGTPDSWDINRYLRDPAQFKEYWSVREAEGRNYTSFEWVQQASNDLIQAFDKYAAPLDQPITVYRGIPRITLDQYFGEKEPPIGSVFEHAGMISTSLDPNQARDWVRDFGGGLVAEIRIPAGTKIISGRTSGIMAENEILLRHDTKLRLVQTQSLMGDVIFEVVP